MYTMAIAPPFSAFLNLSTGLHGVLESKIVKEQINYLAFRKTSSVKVTQVRTLTPIKIEFVVMKTNINMKHVPRVTKTIFPSNSSLFLIESQLQA